MSSADGGAAAGRPSDEALHWTRDEMENMTNAVLEALGSKGMRHCAQHVQRLRAALASAEQTERDLRRHIERRAAGTDPLTEHLRQKCEEAEARSASAEQRARTERNLTAMLLCETGRVPDPRFDGLRPVDVREVLSRGSTDGFHGTGRPLTDDEAEIIVTAYLRALGAAPTEGRGSDRDG